MKFDVKMGILIMVGFYDFVKEMGFEVSQVV